MLDLILKYLSIITLAGAAISFVVGLVKYLDQRNREERTTRYKLFHDLMGPIVARGERPNEGLALSQQAAAVYELQHFKDYSYPSVPILQDMRDRWGNEPEIPRLLLRAIDETLEVLRRTPAGRCKRLWRVLSRLFSPCGSGFKFKKRGQLFIRTHNKASGVLTLCGSNPQLLLLMIRA